MSGFVIYPLNVGNLTLEKSFLAHQIGQGEVITMPILAWYVTDGQRKILVDTGPMWPDGVFPALSMKEEQKIDNQLRAIGVSCADIQTVFLTHLHWDHAFNNHLFPQAEFFVQKKELQFAVTPIPIHANQYFLDVILKTKYHVIDGDYKFCDGITLMTTPGHSPGSMSVIVETAEGTYGILGDLIAFLECWERDPKIPNGFLTNLEATYESFARLERVIDYALPGHEARLLERKSYP